MFSGRCLSKSGATPSGPPAFPALTVFRAVANSSWVKACSSSCRGEPSSLQTPLRSSRTARPIALPPTDGGIFLDESRGLCLVTHVFTAFVNYGFPILGPRRPTQALHNCPGFLGVFRTGHFFEMRSPGVTFSFLCYLEHFSCLGDPRVSVRPHISSVSIAFLHKVVLLCIHPWGFFLSAYFLRDCNSGFFLYTINEGLQLGGRVCHGFEKRLIFS